MFKNYHSIQQWDNWLDHSLGLSILEAEKDLIKPLLCKNSINNALIIGSPKQYYLLENKKINNTCVLSPLINKTKTTPYYIESGFYELPIQSGSLDLVLLPHTLELIDFPQKLLNESCRTVKPEGNIIIIGFNPLSMWGLKKIWEKNHKTPWTSDFILPETIKKWLHFADFEYTRKDMGMFRPPLENQTLFDKLKILETLGIKTNAFFGGIYTITAKAKFVPFTPIKLHWRQTLPKLSISSLRPN